MEPFEYWNKTRYVYGAGEYVRVGELLRPMVKNRLLLHYGGGSVKRTGVYDAVV